MAKPLATRLRAARTLLRQHRDELINSHKVMARGHPCFGRIDPDEDPEALAAVRELGEADAALTEAIAVLGRDARNKRREP